MTALYLLIAVALVLLLWAAGTFNGLVRLRQHCRESWADIDAELRRRYDLIPNLVATVKGYAAHEREVLERVTEARNRAYANHGAIRSQVGDENALVDALKGLFAVVEGYPQLKASGNFMQLQQELVNTEDRIQAARRFYNANVRDMNTRVESFPSNLLAAAFNFRPWDFFEVAELHIRQAPAVSV